MTGHSEVLKMSLSLIETIEKNIGVIELIKLSRKGGTELTYQDYCRWKRELQNIANNEHISSP